MIYIKVAGRARRIGAGLMLRRLLFRLGRWLIGLSNLQADPQAGGPHAYHLDPEGQATGFSAGTRAALEKAAEDFEAAARGLAPIHASQQAAFLDGGTTIWQGEGYSIRLMKAMTTIGDIHGLMFGPVLKLEYPLAHGNTTEISQVTFYTWAELQRYLGLAVS
jgi:hypothetical protein